MGKRPSYSDIIVGSRCVQAPTAERLPASRRGATRTPACVGKGGAMVSPEEMRAHADTCKRMAVSFGPGNSEMMREVAALWRRLADDAEARAANPLRPLGASTI